MRYLPIFRESISENSKGPKCLAGALRQRGLGLADQRSMEQEVRIGQVLRELVVAMECPLFCRAEHDERSPGFREPFSLKLMMLDQIGGVGKSCHSAGMGELDETVKN